MQASTFIDTISAISLYESGQQFKKKSDYAAAAEQYRKAALLNYGPAEFKLAYLYQTGLGVPKSLALACEGYSRSLAHNFFSDQQVHLMAKLQQFCLIYYPKCSEAYHFEQGICVGVSFLQAFSAYLRKNLSIHRLLLKQNQITAIPLSKELKKEFIQADDEANWRQAGKIINTLQAWDGKTQFTMSQQLKIINFVHFMLKLQMTEGHYEKYVFGQDYEVCLRNLNHRIQPRTLYITSHKGKLFCTFSRNGNVYLDIPLSTSAPKHLNKIILRCYKEVIVTEMANKGHILATKDGHILKKELSLTLCRDGKGFAEACETLKLHHHPNSIMNFASEIHTLASFGGKTFCANAEVTGSEFKSTKELSLQVFEELGYFEDEQVVITVSVFADVFAARKFYPMKQEILERNLSVSTMNSRNRSPLHEAARAGCIEGITYYLKRGNAIHAIDKDHLTPFTLAGIFDQIESMRCLLKHGSQIQTKDFLRAIAMSQFSETKLLSHNYLKNLTRLDKEFKQNKESRFLQLLINNKVLPEMIAHHLSPYEKDCYEMLAYLLQACAIDILQATSITFDQLSLLTKAALMTEILNITQPLQPSDSKTEATFTVEQKIYATLLNLQSKLTESPDCSSLPTPMRIFVAKLEMMNLEFKEMKNICLDLNTNDEFFYNEDDNLRAIDTLALLLKEYMSCGVELSFLTHRAVTPEYSLRTVLKSKLPPAEKFHQVRQTLDGIVLTITSRAPTLCMFPGDRFFLEVANAFSHPFPSIVLQRLKVLLAATCAYDIEPISLHCSF